MGKYFIIAHANFRKAKGQTISIIVLVFFAALMLNLWLMLSMDYKSNFDRYHNKLNAGHVTLALGSNNSKVQNFISETLGKDKRTEQYSIDSVLVKEGSFDYNDGEISSNFIFLNKQEALKRKVEKIEITEDGSYKSGIYLPMLYSADKNIKPGGEITLKIGNNTRTYTICGFINSIMAGSHNCSMCMFVLTEDKYKELQENGQAKESSFISIRIKDKTKSEDFETSIKDQIASQYPEISTASNSYALVSSSRYISQMICSGIISTMAFLVTLITFVVISSNVINYIQENMKNIGVLKAEGYESRQVVFALLLQFFSVTFITAVIGALVSYVLFPAINNLMFSQTGIPYKIKFLPVPFIIAVAFLAGTVFFAVWLSSRRIKRIEPVVAIRQGIQTHNFKRNHVPLESAHTPVNIALALKTAFSGVKQNITICITMLVISLVLVFSGLMFVNVIKDTKPFIDMIIGETSDSAIVVNADASKRFLSIMENDNRVEKVYLYNTVQVTHKGSIVLMATLSDDFSKFNNQNICIEGRFPKYNNEAAVAIKYANEEGLEIGDEITLEAEGQKAEYIISGFTQLSDNLGKDCLLTRSGYKRMGVLLSECYYINLKDGINIDKFNKEISDRLGNSVNQVVNIKAAIDGSGAVYILLVKTIVIAVIILSLLVTVFVMYLLVRTMLNNKKRDYGIMKAIGYTTGQLILQTAISFMPAVIISVIIGIIAGSMVINPFMALFLKGIGIVKCTFKVSAIFNIFAGVLLILFTFAVVCLMAVKTRKNTPRTLLIGE